MTEKIAELKNLKAEYKEKKRQIKFKYSNDRVLAQKKYEEKLRIKEYNRSLPKRYSMGEEIFNSVSHGIGAGLAIAAIVLFFQFSLCCSNDQ